MKVNFKARLEVQGILLMAKRGPRFPARSDDMGRLLLERIKIPVYHFRVKIGAIFGPSHRRPLAAPLAFSCLSSPSSLPSPPFLQSGDRQADRWTSDIRTEEWGGWRECRNEGEEGEKGRPGGKEARRDRTTTAVARYKVFLRDV